MAGKGFEGAEARFVLKEYLHMKKGGFLKLYVRDLWNNRSVIILLFLGCGFGRLRRCKSGDAESLLRESHSTSYP